MPWTARWQKLIVARVAKLTIRNPFSKRYAERVPCFLFHAAIIRSNQRTLKQFPSGLGGYKRGKLPPHPVMRLIAGMVTASPAFYLWMNQP